MPKVDNRPKNWVKNRSPQGHFEGQDTIPLTLLGDLAGKCILDDSVVDISV